jgi:2-oxoglutarate dehydrogenase E1 component
MSRPELDSLNAGYAGMLLEEYLDNPSNVSPEWRALFESGDPAVVASIPGLARLVAGLNGNGAYANGNGHASPAPAAAPAAPAPAPAAAPAAASAAAPDEQLLGGVAAAMALVKAYRTHGHLAARLDPLGSEPVGDPALDPMVLEPQLTPELQARIPASVLRVHVPGETLAEVLPHLEQTYCGTMAFEIEHLSEHEQRVWLRFAIESGRYRQPLTPQEKLRLLARLSDAEGFEQYLRRAFLGQKQFSLEGVDAMVPMLDEAIDLACESGAEHVVIGMAHRGRLNALTHTAGMPYERILREFEGERFYEAVVFDPEGGSGDVKYHLGAEGIRQTPHGEISVRLLANPSHLEAADPVVEGTVRALQTDRTRIDGHVEPSKALPVLIHGDASFAGQGIVAETFNLQGLVGYETGGTIHLIANNQVGFTTDPHDSRSTRYSSDLAKGFDVPIIHVNADDPESALHAMRLAMAFRKRFAHDVVVDLVGYRRLGHNEADEPAYTQPLTVKKILAQPTVRDLYAAKLLEEGIATEADAEKFVADVQGRVRDAHERLKASFGQAIPASEVAPPPAAVSGEVVVTAVTSEKLRRLNAELLRFPEGFTPNAKLAKQLERRGVALDEGSIEWGHAEALAFASLLSEGVPIRMTGQDSERGTFSHRHLVLHDSGTGATYTPMRHITEAEASFEIHNSPLSEYAVLGFEYGYAIAAPETLVLWEAQFGDFANGAQIIIDQFISSSLSKWHETSRLTLLLPHGYEGNGPEHSSARLERFLQLAAQDNIRVANCTTAAQYFHLLRRQALDPVSRPLVVVTPKGLLRHKDATSTLADLADGVFQPVLDDKGADREQVERLVLCTGKVYYDIAHHEERSGAGNVAVGRVEQLYPFPTQAVAALMASYPKLQEVVWAQEEPQNMGAFRSVRHRLEEALPEGVPLRYTGRPWRASPSEGYPTAHSREQARIAREALTRA